jgi:hypothetical protein
MFLRKTDNNKNISITHGENQMLRSSLIRLSSSNVKRTVVRDPRKKKVRPSLTSLELRRKEENQVDVLKPVNQPLPFAHSGNDQGSVGSTLGSYVLAGVGVTLGFTLVGLILG